MPQVRYYKVDVQVQAAVGGVSDGGGELTQGEALEQVLASLRLIDGGRILVVSATVTETTIGGTPLVTANAGPPAPHP